MPGPGETLQQVGELKLSRLELEPMSQDPVLLLGGGKGTGELFAIELAKQGHEVFIGTRSPEHFCNVREKILAQGGIEPKPFIANITDPDAVEAALEALHLEPGTPLHYFPFAANGFNSAARIAIGRPFFAVSKKIEEIVERHKNTIISPKSIAEVTEALYLATADIKDRVSDPKVTEEGMETNYRAPVRIARMLAERGHLRSQSKVATMSSSPSDLYGKDPDKYPGPYFYGEIIAKPKSMATAKLKQITSDVGGTFVDIVAPEISDTDVGAMIEKMAAVLRVVIPGLKLPSVTREEVVQAAMQELKRRGVDVPNIRTAYIVPVITRKGKELLRSTKIVYEQPEEYKIPLLPFL